MRTRKRDPLSDLLRQGDSASDIAETAAADERRAALLARCADDAVPSSVPTRRAHWSRPALAAAAVAGAVLLLGLYPRLSRVAPNIPVVTTAVPVRPPSPPSVRVVAVAPPTPRPIPPAPETKKTVSPVAPALSSPEPRAEQKRQRRRYLAQAAGSGKRRTERRKSEKRTPQPIVSPPAPETAVERIIVIGDNMPVPAQPEPPPAAIAIVFSGSARSVIVAHPTEPPSEL